MMFATPETRFRFHLVIDSRPRHSSTQLKAACGPWFFTRHPLRKNLDGVEQYACSACTATIR